MIINTTGFLCFIGEMMDFTFTVKNVTILYQEEEDEENEYWSHEYYDW